jgi:DNA repair protein RadA/Sms
VAKSARARLSLGKNLKTCPACGTKFGNHRAQCPGCKVFDFGAPRTGKPLDDGTVLASDIAHKPIRMLSTGPWDRAFGEEMQPDGSLVHGIPVVGIILLSGDAGAGKSTVALQIADAVIELSGREVLYIAKEEAKEQVISRAKRIGFKHLGKLRIYPLEAQTDLGNIFDTRIPVMTIVDSGPKLIPNPEDLVVFVENLKDYVIAHEMPAIVINHIIKGGDMAGLNKLQHAVDTTLDFLRDDPDDEGNMMRYLNVKKNRFGPDSISLPFLMTAKGLVVPNGNIGDDEEDEDEEGDEHDDEDDEDD